MLSLAYDFWSSIVNHGVNRDLTSSGLAPRAPTNRQLDGTEAIPKISNVPAGAAKAATLPFLHNDGLNPRGFQVLSDDLIDRLLG